MSSLSDQMIVVTVVAARSHSAADSARFGPIVVATSVYSVCGQYGVAVVGVRVQKHCAGRGWWLRCAQEPFAEGGQPHLASVEQPFLA